jgi:hypothetical protein
MAIDSDDLPNPSGKLFSFWILQPPHFFLSAISRILLPLVQYDRHWTWLRLFYCLALFHLAQQRNQRERLFLRMHWLFPTSLCTVELPSLQFRRSFLSGRKALVASVGETRMGGADSHLCCAGRFLLLESSVGWLLHSISDQGSLQMQQ